MSKANHKNSHIITIFRSGSFLSRAQGTKDAEVFFGDSKQSIGSYFESSNSRAIGSGLTTEEIEVLLPKFVGVQPNHPEFMNKVDFFYKEISTDVAYNGGIQLQIGMSSVNTLPVKKVLNEDGSTNMDKSNLPLDDMDYIRYKHALNHPQVAENKEGADGNSLVTFYIFDKALVNKQKVAANDLKDQALEVYTEFAKDSNKVDMMLTLLGVNLIDIPEAHERKIKFRELSESDAQRVVDLHKNKDIDIEYSITKMVKAKVLKKVGERYLVAEDNATIGNNLEEAVFYFKDDKNSEVVSMLKARLQSEN